MTGKWLRRWSFRISRVISSPSMSGIMTSLTTSETFGSSRSRRRASAPLVAVSMGKLLPSSLRRYSRMSALSSTMSSFSLRRCCSLAETSEPSDLPFASRSAEGDSLITVRSAR